MKTLPVLFDANGRFGGCSFGTPMFAAPEDLLAHMDRLGVDRALVWSTDAEGGNCPVANRKMLNRLSRCPEAKGRLIPCLAISPTMIYEEGAVEGLKRMIKRTGVAALRLPCSVSGAHTLRHTEPIIAALSAARPTVFVHHSDADPADVVALAEGYPSASFILTEVMWQQYVFAFDLMRRCKNVLIESSWLHTPGAVELIVNEFGADRIVFGLGGRSHNGASVAALMHAQVSDRQRGMIAHGNLERLLQLKPAAAGRARTAAHTGDTFWSRLIGHKRLGVGIIDAHAHLGPLGGFVLAEQSVPAHVSMALKGARMLGITTTIVMADRALERVLRPYGRRFRGYFAFNPHRAKELARTLDAAFAGGFFVGFKTHCDSWRVPITDQRYTPMFEYADRHRLPILSHTWTSPNDSPAMFKDIVRRYPNAQFLMGHSGGTDRGRREAEELAVSNDNVYLEWCGSFCSSIPWEETLATVGNHKVVFGTDGMSHSVVWELGRFVSLDLPDATLCPILGDNMRKILAMRAP